MLAKDGGEPFACLRFKRKIWADSGAFPSPRVSGSRKLEKEGKKKSTKWLSVKAEQKRKLESRSREEGKGVRWSFSGKSFT